MSFRHMSFRHAMTTIQLPREIHHDKKAGAVGKVAVPRSSQTQTALSLHNAMSTYCCLFNTLTIVTKIFLK